MFIQKPTRMGINGVIIAISGLELILTIWSAVICGVVCGGSGSCGGSCYGCDECYEEQQYGVREMLA
jgi:hypothetical protein